MQPIIIFDASLLVLLQIEIFLLTRSSLQKLYDKAVIFTILIYRVATWVAILLGIRFNELGTSQWRYDHKWIGLTIVILVLLFWPKKKYPHYKAILLGIGTGQMIDEVSEFLMLLGFPIPLNFRDSLPDVCLILLTLGLFLVIRQFLKRTKLEQLQRLTN